MPLSALKCYNCGGQGHFKRDKFTGEYCRLPSLPRVTSASNNVAQEQKQAVIAASNQQAVGVARSFAQVAAPQFVPLQEFQAYKEQMRVKHEQLEQELKRVSELCNCLREEKRPRANFPEVLPVFPQAQAQPSAQVVTAPPPPPPQPPIIPPPSESTQAAPPLSNQLVAQQQAFATPSRRPAGDSGLPKSSTKRKRADEHPDSAEKEKKASVRQKKTPSRKRKSMSEPEEVIGMPVVVQEMKEKEQKQEQSTAVAPQAVEAPRFTALIKSPTRFSGILRTQTEKLWQHAFGHQGKKARTNNLKKLKEKLATMDSAGKDWKASTSAEEKELKVQQFERARKEFDQEKRKIMNDAACTDSIKKAIAPATIQSVLASFISSRIVEPSPLVSGVSAVANASRVESKENAAVA